MKTSIQLLFIIALFISCSKNEVETIVTKQNQLNFISAVDISNYPEISEENLEFYNLEGTKNDFLNILTESGVNTIRLRLWVNPANSHSSFDEVKTFSLKLKSKGFKIWLTLHYSDTWADPANQATPLNWQGLNFTELKDKVYSYTEKVVKELQPDYIQIGNEINPGFLHPNGHIIDNSHFFKELLNTATSAVRKNSTISQIILHYAGITGSNRFFNEVKDIDYDIIGLSFYPIWHGKDLNVVKNKMNELSEFHDKKIVIAETSYPFTLEWNDWTNNIIGSEDQLIIPEYPATIEGQRKFINKIKNITQEVENGLGFCYWGAELISWKGKESTNASPWENQALFDFNNKALPVMSEFKIEE
jgi:arabinogalactan endo-1,4-beta-galactosidase